MLWHRQRGAFTIRRSRPRTGPNPRRVARGGLPMSDPPPGETLPHEQPERRGPACDRFEAEWLAGRSPRLEELLGGAAEADRPALLRELLALELGHRARRGERPRAEEYAR